MVTAVPGGSKNTQALTVTAAAGPGGPAGGPGPPAPAVPSLLGTAKRFPRCISGTRRLPFRCPRVPAGRCRVTAAPWPPRAGDTRLWRRGGLGAGCARASPQPLIHLSQQEMPKLPFQCLFSAGCSALGLAFPQCRRWRGMCPTSAGDPSPASKVKVCLSRCPRARPAGLRAGTFGDTVASGARHAGVSGQPDPCCERGARPPAPRSHSRGHPRSHGDTLRSLAEAVPAACRAVPGVGDRCGRAWHTSHRCGRAHLCPSPPGSAAHRPVPRTEPLPAIRPVQTSTNQA